MKHINETNSGEIYTIFMQEKFMINSISKMQTQIGET